jgi:hypothetical protein
MGIAKPVVESRFNCVTDCVVIKATLASTPIGVAIVVIGASFGGSVFYDYAISDTVKSTLNSWFSDTPEQKQQKFNMLLPLFIR